jgi:hypothetical protein
VICAERVILIEVKSVRFLALVVMSFAISCGAYADTCTKTSYVKTVPRPEANWLICLSDGSVFEEGGSDFDSSVHWTPGEEVVVCSSEGESTFRITSLARKQSVYGWPILGGGEGQTCSPPSS